MLSILVYIYLIIGMFFVGITISEMRKERIKFDSMHVIELLFILIGWPIPIGYAVYLTITNPYDL